ncbi:MAG: class II glutamine amidotransferase [Elusimicrobia bacterium]|nr:class II glutamine amidotransferase [Elusimicrobiota bacterium]
MCRLFAQISPSPTSATPHLVESEFSLLRQSDFNKDNLQKDGWGIGYFGNKNEPVVSKSPKPAFMEKELFSRAARPAAKIVIGHIRAASNPRDLPESELLSEANSQPFTDGEWLFAHNGTLNIPGEVTENLGSLAQNLKSLNDSEVYFWQFIKFYRKTKDPIAALRSCVKENWELWEKCRGAHPDKKGPYTTLNAVLSDGRRLYAFCHGSRPSTTFGVYNPDQPWSVMSFAQRGNMALISSENLDRGDSWTRFNPPEILSAEIAGGVVRLERIPAGLEVPASIPKNL